MSLTIRSVYDYRDSYSDIPLLIVGPGPSFDAFPFQSIPARTTIFALNHAITESYHYGDTYWISHDHDRTFGNAKLRKALISRLHHYFPWRTITNRKFLPKPFGDIAWTDQHGRLRQGCDVTVPFPYGSEVWWYHENQGREGFVHHGHTVFELALRVATIWGFRPILVVGVDFELLGDRRNPVYYASPWQWKDIPRAILSRGKLKDMKASVRRNLHLFSSEVFFVSKYLQGLPFRKITAERALVLLDDRKDAVEEHQQVG